MPTFRPIDATLRERIDLKMTLLRSLMRLRAAQMPRGTVYSERDRRPGEVTVRIIA